MARRRQGFLIYKNMKRILTKNSQVITKDGLKNKIRERFRGHIGVEFDKGTRAALVATSYESAEYRVITCQINGNSYGRDMSLDQFFDWLSQHSDVIKAYVFEDSSEFFAWMSKTSPY